MSERDDTIIVKLLETINCPSCGAFLDFKSGIESNSVAGYVYTCSICGMETAIKAQPDFTTDE